MADALPDPYPTDDEPLLSTLLSESPQLWDVVEDFVRALPTKMAAIETALHSGSLDQVRLIARDLADQGVSCGYVSLRDQAAGIEQAACDQVSDQLSAKITELRELIARIQAGLQCPDE